MFKIKERDSRWKRRRERMIEKDKEERGGGRG